MSIFSSIFPKLLTILIASFIGPVLELSDGTFRFRYVSITALHKKIMKNRRFLFLTSAVLSFD